MESKRKLRREIILTFAVVAMLMTFLCFFGGLYLLFFGPNLMEPVSPEHAKQVFAEDILKSLHRARIYYKSEQGREAETLSELGEDHDFTRGTTDEWRKHIRARLRFPLDNPDAYPDNAIAAYVFDDGSWYFLYNDGSVKPKVAHGR